MLSHFIKPVFPPCLPIYRRALSPLFLDPLVPSLPRGGWSAAANLAPASCPPWGHQAGFFQGSRLTKALAELRQVLPQCSE